MSTERTHRVTTTDGVELVGTVHGTGPSLVFLHAVAGDGDIDWEALVGSGRAFTAWFTLGRVAVS
jgi:hypothetical protein